MAEVFAKAGDPVPESGLYACSKCGERRSQVDHRGEKFPTEPHCPESPWMLMVRADEEPSRTP